MEREQEEQDGTRIEIKESVTPRQTWESNRTPRSLREEEKDVWILSFSD